MSNQLLRTPARRLERPTAHAFPLGLGRRIAHTAETSAQYTTASETRCTAVVASLAVLAATLVAAPVALSAQSVPVRTLTRPQAEFPDPFTLISGVRELKDGRVVVADARDRLLQLVDLRTGSATAIGREGSGPNEYKLPFNTIAIRGDSTLVGDPLNGRFLVVGPSGQAAGLWTPAAAPAAAAPARPAGGAPRGGMVMMGGGPMAMINVRGSDPQGALFSPGPAVQMTDKGPQSADSVPILRTPRAGGKVDTIAYVALASANTSVSGSGGNMNIQIGGAPFPAQDEWAVFPDGRVAVVRHADYHVDMYPAGGRAPVRGPRVAYTPVRVGEAEKQAYRDARRGGLAIAMTQGGPGAGRTSASTAPANINAAEPSSWPAVKPPFQERQVFAMSNGELWVGLHRSASDRQPRFDVFDTNGRRTAQVVLPVGTRLVGSGQGVAYVARTDDDDLQYLQRYALTP